MGGVRGKNKKRKGKRWVKRGNEHCDGVMSDVNYIYPSIMHPSPLQVCYDWSGGGAHLGQVGSASVRHNTIQCGLSHLHQGAIYCYSQPCRANSNKYPAVRNNSYLSYSYLSYVIGDFILLFTPTIGLGCLFTS